MKLHTFEVVHDSHCVFDCQATMHWARPKQASYVCKAHLSQAKEGNMILQARNSIIVSSHVRVGLYQALDAAQVAI